MSVFIFTPLLVFLVPFLTIRNHRSSEYTKKRTIFLFFVMFVILLGFKNEGGQDDASYRAYYEFNYSNSFTFLKGMEPLFLILRIIGRAAGFNYKWLFFSYSVIAGVFLCKALYNWFDTSDDIQLFAAAFLFIALPKSFTVMRQTVAMSIVFYAYSLKDIEWKKKVLLWIGAVLSHYGFIIIIPLEIFGLINKYRVSTAFKWLFPAVCFLLGSSGVVPWVINIVVTVTGMYTYMDVSKVAVYSGSGIVNMVILIIYYVVLYLEVNRRYSNISRVEEKEEGRYDADPVVSRDHRKLQFGEMVFLSLLLLTQKIWGAVRISYYYLFFAAALIPHVIHAIRFKYQSRKIAEVISILGLYGMYLVYVRGMSLGTSISWSLNFWN